MPREAPATTLRWPPGAQAPVVGPNFPTGATTTLYRLMRMFGMLTHRRRAQGGCTKSRGFSTTRASALRLLLIFVGVISARQYKLDYQFFG